MKHGLNMIFWKQILLFFNWKNERGSYHGIFFFHIYNFVGKWLGCCFTHYAHSQEQQIYTKPVILAYIIWFGQSGLSCKHTVRQTLFQYKTICV